ncbi:MAG: alpha/beta fold hydrolase [Bacteroidetes bacterium]|nr:alpha/beta fold hydrolase [Bacteroidota bacterium]
MKNVKSALFIIGSLILSILSASEAFSQQKNPGILQLSGKWSGKVQTLEVVFCITPQEDSVVVTLDSPDQGVMGIPVNGYTFQNDSVIFDVESIGGKFTGKFNPAGPVIEGMWYQGGIGYPLNLTPNDQYTGLLRPQEPKPPYPYIVEDVTFPNKSAGITLAGTLTLPDGGDPFAAAIMVTGSGAQNRDEELLGHKPFLVIADYLTLQGTAVLRYDDRGFGKSTGDMLNSTTGDFATDAYAAFEFLKQDTRINPAKIGIIGHSEGAMIASMVAAEHPDIAFIVMMAGSGLSGEEILFVQSGVLLRASGESEKNIKKVEDFNRKVYKIAISDADREQAKKKLRKAFAGFTKDMTEMEKNRMGFSDYVIEATIRDLLNPWMRYFLRLDIKPYLSRVKCPVLILNGDKDLQVPPKENIPPIEDALRKGGNTDYKVVILPELNHLFQSCESGSPAEYARIQETFSPKALEVISEWVNHKVSQD